MVSQLERDFIRSLLIKDETKTTRQTGGSIETISIGEHKLKYTLKVHTFLDKSIEILVISFVNNTPCFRLSITPGDNSVACLLSLDKECFLDNYDNSRDLVKAAYIIAKNKGAKTLKITDNSTIYCPDKVYLSNLSFLTTGKTWYESILDVYPAEDENNELATMRKRAFENKWIDVANNLLRKDIVLPFSVKGIDINEQGSAMKVLAKAKNSKKFCNLFGKYMSEILLSSNIINFKGKEWLLDIN